jgi:amino acid transporter
MEGLQVGTGVRLGNKQLRTIDCVAQSLAVGPIFSAALLGSILAANTGGVGPAVIILTAIGVLGIGWTVSEFAKRYAGAGTVYEYIAKSLGKRPAVFAAGSYYLGILALASVGIPLIGGMLARAFFKSHIFGLDLPWWVYSLVIVGLMALVTTLGVELSVRTQLAVIVFSLIPFAILIGKIVIDGGVSGNSARSFNPGNVAAGGSVFKGILFAILMFVGFELAAALGEETATPKKSIPRAVLATIGVVFVVYLLTQYAISIGSSDTIPPFFEAMGDAYVGRWLMIWIELAVLLDILAVGIGFSLAGARGLFTLSRDGLLPRSLSKLNVRQQPENANKVMAAVGVIGILITVAVYSTNAFLDPDGNQIFPVREKAFYAFLVCSTIGALIICTSYILLCLGALKTFALRSPVSLIAAVVGLAIAVLGVSAQFVDDLAPTGDAKWGIYIGVGCLIAAALWTAVSKRSAVDAVGQHTIHLDVEAVDLRRKPSVQASFAK